MVPGKAKEDAWMDMDNNKGQVEEKKIYIYTQLTIWGLTLRKGKESYEGWLCCVVTFVCDATFNDMKSHSNKEIRENMPSCR